MRKTKTKRNKTVNIIQVNSQHLDEEQSLISSWRYKANVVHLFHIFVVSQNFSSVTWTVFGLEKAVWLSLKEQTGTRYYLLIKGFSFESRDYNCSNQTTNADDSVILRRFEFLTKKTPQKRCCIFKGKTVFLNTSRHSKNEKQLWNKKLKLFHAN